MKETHIMPSEFLSAEDSRQAALSSTRSGIKEHGNREIEKLSNGILSLEVDNTSVNRTNMESAAGGEGGGDLDDTIDRQVVEKIMGRNGDIDHASNVSTDSGQAAERGAVELTRTDNDAATGLAKEFEEKLRLGAGDVSCDSLSRTEDCRRVKPVEEIHKEARHKSKMSLAPRYAPSPKECSVMSCLNHFTAAELLTGSNRVSCRVCTKTGPRSTSPRAKGILVSNLYG